VPAEIGAPGALTFHARNTEGVRVRYVAAFAAGVFAALTVVLAVAFLQKDPAGDPPAPVAVTVNGIPITENQVRSLAGRLEGASPDKDVRERAAVERLIQQQLFANEAVAEKLHEQPQVADALRDARNQILAQAYVERTTSASTAPSEADISDYYSAHPQLFAERKIYRLQEIVIETSRNRLAALDAQYQKIRTLNDMVAWLDANQFAYRSGAAEKPAEALPADLLPHLAKLQKGETVRVSTPAGMTIVQLSGFRVEPVAPAEARPLIRRFLANQAKAKATSGLAQELRRNARIEYAERFRKPSPK
jgi:EpsD family peptidyl-prolyl cis-trans isomerase